MMMVRHLLFTLYGPLAAWGDMAPGTRRPSLERPTKSAVLGLVAAALGYRHDEDSPHIDLDQRFGYAVRMDARGVLLRDYHTTQTVHRMGKRRLTSRRQELLYDPEQVDTILSSRDHRADACWTVCLWERKASDPSLEQIKEHLIAPRFTLYLGRKSCPLSLPTAPEIVESQTLRNAFLDYSSPHPQFLEELDWAQPPELAWDEGHPDAGIVAEQSRHTRDIIVSRVRRSFRDRLEHVAWAEVPPIQREVGAST